MPDYYRANSILDVGCGSAEITKAIAERHRIQMVHALEISDIGFAVANRTLSTEATFSDLLKAEAKIKADEIHSDVDEIVNYIAAMNYGLKRLENFP
ncbi:hypothetical protein KKG82_01055 [Patescibacteria group bacterium]|nr:hypothetical protein [Patescibacteria group bacterium]